MGRELVDSGPLRASFDRVPNHVLCHAVTPQGPILPNRPEQFSFTDAGGPRPTIRGSLDPFRYGDGANVAALSNQIGCPEPLIPIVGVRIQVKVQAWLRRASRAGYPDRSRSRATVPAERIASFLCGAPGASVPSLADTRDQFGAEETTVSRFVGEPPYGRQTDVDRRRCQLCTLQLQAITKNNGTIQRQPRL